MKMNISSSLVTQSSHTGALYSKAELREIVGRAIQIDTAHDETFSLGELHQAAHDAGVSPVALAAAIVEFERGDRSWTGFVRHCARQVATFGPAGIAIGLASELAMPTLTASEPLTWTLHFFVLTLLTSGVLASISARTGVLRSALTFQFRNAGLWAGLLTGMYAGATWLAPAGMEDVIRLYCVDIGLRMWAGSTIVGGAIAAWRNGLGRARVNDAKRRLIAKVWNLIGGQGDRSPADP